MTVVVERIPSAFSRVVLSAGFSKFDRHVIR